MNMPGESCSTAMRLSMVAESHVTAQGAPDRPLVFRREMTMPQRSIGPGKQNCPAFQAKVLALPVEHHQRYDGGVISQAPNRITVSGERRCVRAGLDVSEDSPPR